MHRSAVELEWSQGITTVHDRSIYGDAVFAAVLHQDGLIDELGYSSYLKHRECMQGTLLVPQQIFYLDVPVDVALRRIAGRGRSCEQGIMGDYLEKLAQQYALLLDELSSKTNVSVYEWKDGMTVDNVEIKGVIQYEEVY